MFIESDEEVQEEETVKSAQATSDTPVSITHLTYIYLDI